ncbi:probable ATP-dependent RNA helicase DDX52 isoform X1 [Homarus americanus]|uniref:probable ATP-dependent RNA helicase DDX52 isoform X1 n=2 Tax=Homarus americanus TaxID=6706 RepID=UPI001C439737|nr:probable ATP-dependent RNA helicase DDX52 isoform X1 [Homarus americanus]
MNSYDIFRKLTKGIKFNNKKFKSDFQKSRDQQSVQELGNEDSCIADDSKPESDKELCSAEEQNSKLEDGSENEEGGLSMLTDVQFGGAASDKKKKKKTKKSAKQKQLELHQEQVNHMRKKNGIHVWGADVPEPLDSFDKLLERFGVNEIITSNLRSQGFASPTPIQMQAWPLMLQGREVLGCAPTGSGKTAAFLVPLLHQLGGPQRKGFRAVILSPTRELARQTHRECVRLAEGLGIRAFIISNVSKAMEKFGPQSAQKFDVLVTTPNRLVYLLQEVDGSPLNLSNVEWLVIDESDRLFEAGEHGFRDQLAVVYQACTGPNIRRALFSATFAHEVQDWCKLNLNNVAMVSVGIRNTASEDVKQDLKFCGDESGKLLALRDILRKGYEPPVLLFVQTKERAKDLFKELIYDNIMVDAIHSDRTQLQRDNVVRAFRERKIWVLICTELMARGIDFKGVNLVINFDFPPSAISYIHRVGRTGRAHHQGHAITFWTMDDKPFLRSVAQVIHSSGQEVPSWMLELKKLRRKEKKKLSTQQPDRGHVSQGVLYEQLNKRRQKEMVKKSKKMKFTKNAAEENRVERDRATQK